MNHRLFAVKLIGLMLLITVIGACALAATEVTTWAELSAALKNGGDIVVMNDIKDTDNAGVLTVPTGVTATLDLNGHTIDRNRTVRTSTGALDTSDASIKSKGVAGNVIVVSGNLTLNDSSADPSTGIGDGAITGGYIYGNGGGIRVESGGTLTMNAGKITGNVAQHGGGIANNGKLVINGGSVDHNATEYYGGGVNNTSEMIMTGGVIDSNKASRSGGICMNNANATLDMSNASLTNNTASWYGGGLRVEKAKWIKMDSVTVSGNTAGNDGGGIQLGCDTTITGDSVFENNKAGTGSAIYAGAGTTSISDNTVIRNNNATGGGTVFINSATVNISDNVAITGNTAKNYGSAIEMESASSVLNMSGGTITGNTVTTVNSGMHKGAIQFYKGSMTLSGDVVIYDNTNAADGSQNNLYLRENSVTLNASGLSDKARIGIGSRHMEDNTKPGEIEVSDDVCNGRRENFAVDTFPSDPEYAVAYDDAKKIVLRTGYDVHFNDGDTEIGSRFTGYGNTVSNVPKASKDGYLMKGWYKDPELTQPWDPETEVITEEITVYALFEEAPKTGDAFDPGLACLLMLGAVVLFITAKKRIKE